MDALNNILAYIFISVVLCSASCGRDNGQGSGPGPADNSFSGGIGVFVPVVGEEALAAAKAYDQYLKDCIREEYYYCPPLDEVWQMKIKKDICNNVILEVGECEEVFECDPLNYEIGDYPCTTSDNYPGYQTLYCNKGYKEYGPCKSDCSEEVCDGVDNDCDGEVDEGQLNACGGCGPVPPESCDGFDNDCDGDIDEDLYMQCKTSCGVGLDVCVNGMWQCSAPQPAPEVCDGLDNDCDGKVDEDLDCGCTINDVGVLMPCNEPPLICGAGYKTCECQDPLCQTILTTECYALCHYIPSVDPDCDPLVGVVIEKEICNNWDDNCNQLIDEDLYSACYTGPPETLGIGICEAGEVVCEAGQWGSYEDELFIPQLCAGEVTPQKDICNGVDDDCDGEADAGKELVETDILFIVDVSGSMTDEITNVLAALNKFSSNYSDKDIIHWGIIIGPVDSYYKDSLSLHQNLTSFDDFMTQFSALNVSSMFLGGGHEMLYDAVYLSLYGLSSTLSYVKSLFSWDSHIDESSPPVDEFTIDWRPDAEHVIIIFTDEPGQSYLNPKVTKNDLVNGVTSANKLKVYTFTVSADKPDWEPVSTASGGKWFELVPSIQIIYESLVYIIEENACTE